MELLGKHGVAAMDYAVELPCTPNAEMCDGLITITAPASPP